jgi:hypothetical protein
MDLSYISFLLFAGFSSLRMVSYLPQIYRVAIDRNGASAVSYSTWGLWVCANATTALYAFNNLNEPYLGWVSVVYAVCCTAVIGLTMAKRRRYRAGRVEGEAFAPRPRWLRPAAGVAVAGVCALAVGFGAGHAAPDAWRRLSGALVAHPVVESAVADTPFGDEAPAATSRPPEGRRSASPPGSPSGRQATPASLPETRFEARARPEAKKGASRPGAEP